MEGGGIERVVDVVLRRWVATHEETQARLSAHLEGELHGREARRVLRHLARCPHCREVLRTLARAVNGLQSLGRVDSLPASRPSFADAVVDRIRRSD
jgi:predicted anti-sigma-YlaC factor YlaD